jgi:hypothetical protein
VVKVSSIFLFILIHGQFGIDLFGNHHGLTLHATMRPPTEDGLGRRWWGCGRTLDAAVPGLSPIATDFMLWAAGWA